MSDSDECFDLHRDIKPYNFEPLAKKVTESINCEEITAVSTNVDLKQPPNCPADTRPRSTTRLRFGVYIFESYLGIIRHK